MLCNLLSEDNKVSVLFTRLNLVSGACLVRAVCLLLRVFLGGCCIRSSSLRLLQCFFLFLIFLIRVTQAAQEATRDMSPQHASAGSHISYTEGPSC